MPELVRQHLVSLASAEGQLPSADHVLFEHLEVYLSDPLALLSADLAPVLLTAKLQALLVLHKFHPSPRGFPGRLWPQLTARLDGNATRAAELALAILRLSTEQLVGIHGNQDQHHLWHNHRVFLDWLDFCRANRWLSGSEALLQLGVVEAAAAAAVSSADPANRELDQAFIDSCSGAKAPYLAQLRRRHQMLCRQRLDQVSLRWVRIEEASPDGRVILLRGAVSQADVRRLIALVYASAKLAGGQLIPAAVADARGRVNRGAGDLRLAGYTRLADSDSQLVAAVTSRVARLVGLADRVREDLQVINYALAGYYQAHYDAFVARSSETQVAGDRIATALIYLTDVPKGGHTVFPLIGARIRPIRGDIVYWRNLDSSGQLDELTYHGACPVIYGSKWIATIWFREKRQTDL